MKESKVLIIDDEELFREDLALLLREKGFQCYTAVNGEDGIIKATEKSPDVILSDINMPGRSGIDIISDLKRVCPECCLIMITSFGSMQTAIDAFRKGASDYILKPLVIEDVLQKINRYIEYRNMYLEIGHLRRELSYQGTSSDLKGESSAIEKVRKTIHKVANLDTTILVTGESGTGKEVVARSIHEASDRKDKPFVAVNCAALSLNLLESELFGHKKGSFTGAIKDKKGLFETASGSTLFLDEISETPLELQVKLLRVLEEREVLPVGATIKIPIDVRVISSTNRDLKEWVQSRNFREDLYFRLNVLEIRIPALRERISDIPILIELFITKINYRLNKKYKGIDTEALRHLMAYAWPGNVRELLNVIERAMILGDGTMITHSDFSSDIVEANSNEPTFGGNLQEAVKAYEREYLRQKLSDTNGNREETAALLGINVATLYRKLAEYGLKKTTD